MAWSTAQVSVGTTATLVAGGSDSAIRNGHATTNLFIGGSDVTTANGWLVKPDEVHAVSAASDEDVYAVAASGTVTVYVMQRGF